MSGGGHLNVARGVCFTDYTVTIKLEWTYSVGGA